MPVHVEQMNTEINLQPGNLPWSQEQIESLVKLVIERMQHKQANEQAVRNERSLHASVLPPDKCNE